MSTKVWGRVAAWLFAILVVGCCVVSVGVHAQTVVETTYPVDGDSEATLTVITVSYPDTITFASDSFMISWKYTKAGVDTWIGSLTLTDSVGAVPKAGVVVVTKEPEPLWSRADVNRDGKIGTGDLVWMYWRICYGIEL